MQNTDQSSADVAAFDDEANAAEAVREKLADAQTPGYQAEFDPEEAERAGAFVEDALSEQDAAESGIDLVHGESPADPFPAYVTGHPGAAASTAQADAAAQFHRLEKLLAGTEPKGE